jgi:phosphatidylglycerol:prolipoprotein diacylglycerol transferase
VSHPLIPYLSLPELPIVPPLDLPVLGHLDAISIKPFGTLVATGVYIGWALTMRQAKRHAMNAEVMNSFIVHVVACGFFFGHVFDVILYHPDKITHAPTPLDALAELLFVWRSLSSFGGFMGALLGLILWKIRYKIRDTVAWADLVASAFPLAWVFGRTGCSVAHDHPGMRSDVWFAVQYPGGGRFDLGLYEMLFTVPLALTFLVMMRRPRPFGMYLGLMCMAYAPTRFALDFVRAQDVRDADPRHLGLTPAQWLCSGLMAAGIAMFFRGMWAAERGETPFFPPPSPDAPDESGGEAGEGEADAEGETEGEAPDEGAPVKAPTNPPKKGPPAAAGDADEALVPSAR